MQSRWRCCQGSLGAGVASLGQQGQCACLPCSPCLKRLVSVDSAAWKGLGRRGQTAWKQSRSSQRQYRLPVALPRYRAKVEEALTVREQDDEARERGRRKSDAEARTKGAVIASSRTSSGQSLLLLPSSFQDTANADQVELVFQFAPYARPLGDRHRRPRRRRRDVSLFWEARMPPPACVRQGEPETFWGSRLWCRCSRQESCASSTM
jgi:hypothetical protein